MGLTFVPWHRRLLLVESTVVVPAKYPSKVKLENFHNSKMSELGEIMRILVYEGFGVFIVGGVDIHSLA